MARKRNAVVDTGRCLLPTRPSAAAIASLAPDFKNLSKKSPGGPWQARTKDYDCIETNSWSPEAFPQND